MKSGLQSNTMDKLISQMRAKPMEWSIGMGNHKFAIKNTHGRKIDSINLHVIVGLFLL